MTCKPLALTWALSTISGYGIYGLQIALQFFRRGGERFIATHHPALTILPTLTQMRIAPLLDAATKIDKLMHDNPQERLTFDHAVLHAVGNECAGFEGQDRICGTVNVGCAAIEHASFGTHAMEYARNYDMFLSISRWNDAFLKSLNIAPVHLCHQGIDTTLFMPGPRTNLWKNRFVIFSGGKFEFRKGQDIVCEAFRRFHARHPEALLITCWQNLLPIDPAPFALAGHCHSTPHVDPQAGLQVSAWMREQGLPQGSFIDLPYTPNMFMPPVLRECDAAIFPNRCEGGTNLVAMECMACGVPTIVSDNTGQKDLVELIGCRAFEGGKKVQPTPDMMSVQDWGETDPDSVVEALEKIYTDRADAAAYAAQISSRMRDWDWGPLNEKILKLVCD